MARTTIERIPIPTDRAREKDPIFLELQNLESWPGPHRIRLVLDWNSANRSWIFQIERVNTGKIVERGRAEVNWPYTYRGYVMFMFLDRARTERRVTPNNLGDEIQLVAFPGPDSEAFEPEEPLPDRPRSLPGYRTVGSGIGV